MHVWYCIYCLLTFKLNYFSVPTKPDLVNIDYINSSAILDIQVLKTGINHFIVQTITAYSDVDNKVCISEG